MKEKDLVEVVASEKLSLDELYEQYTTYTKMESELKKKKAKLKEQIDAYFEEQGKQDNVGNYWLETQGGSFKKEIRTQQVLNSTYADPILRRLMIFDKVVTYEPVYDLDVIKNYIADGTITSDLVDKMFETKVSYATKTQKKTVS